MKKNYNKKKKKIKKILDDLWAEIIKLQSNHQCVAGPLLNEECGGKLNSHHIEGRKKLSVRWDLDNGMCLCAKHHTMGNISAHAIAHSGQVEFHQKVMIPIYGTEKLDELKFKSNQTKKWNLTELEDYLSYLKGIKAIYE